MPIIGTAGHVDHGKSTLVEALTGRDPDRWAEEKERGLTIDLGFAWTEIDGAAVGFVDVPGHERFIKNMLAGVGAVDVALFVVAADEGWMPQTEEHLAVLDLLDVRHGVIAVTRADIVPADVVELAGLEIEDRVAGTSLQGWPVMPTAAPRGDGIASLRAALGTALRRAGAPRDRMRPRLWIDRAFTISGAGTVVTGTLVDGSIGRGDELMLWPQEARVRVRGIQSHETEVDAASPGSRTAINISATEQATITRGAMLGHPDHFRTTRSFLVDLRSVRTLDDPLSDRGAYHLHVGSGSWPARLRFVEEPGRGPAAAVIRTDQGLPLTMGDRVILREVGRRAVVAGGLVLDPHPSNTRKTALSDRLGALRAAVGADPPERAFALLQDRGIAPLADLARDSGGGTPAGTLHTAGIAVSAQAATTYGAALEAAVDEYQRANPLRPGAPKASLASALGLTGAVADLIIETSRRLIDDGKTVRTADFAPAWGHRQEEAWAGAQTLLLEAGLAVPRSSQIGLDDEVLHTVLREGKLVRIAADLVYLPSQLEDLQRRLATLPDGFTVAEFRDVMAMTRRHAVPVLEWLDANGWTSRRGDVRTVRRRPSQGPDAVPPR
jgi:selenocysteine-specific elongation factor